MFDLTNQEITLHNLNSTTTVEVGGIVTFEGRVRIHNQGHVVESLTYEAFDEMSILEGKKIIDEARAQFDIIDAYCVHRTGTLTLKELAVKVVVYAKHRQAAFDACEFIIDQVKVRVPIWKKEIYKDGSSDWVKCLTCAMKGVSHYEHYHHQS